ncbi:hypothetical protein [Geodermatophilus obscurus]|uniref:hypothetical protein n=1 Tax=Geodermatophilus obscurus TaxID=1861 RepID=UPI00140FD3D5|nr:hypothetical protein [Geodermatophilus obscurus]
MSHAGKAGKKTARSPHPPWSDEEKRAAEQAVKKAKREAAVAKAEVCFRLLVDALGELRDLSKPSADAEMPYFLFREEVQDIRRQFTIYVELNPSTGS